jgi:general secretion pathway protein J
MAILSGMLLLGGMALNQGLKQYQGLVQKKLCFWSYAQRIWTDKCFQSMLDYYVNTIDKGWFPYFRGDQEGVSFVTLAPLAGDLPVVVWIRKEAAGDGKSRLVYYEIPVYAKSYREIKEDFASGAYRSGNSVTMIDDADSIQFEYYGYDVRDERHKWRSVFDGADTKHLPMLVQIDYGTGDGNRRSMYAIHVNSHLKRGYGSSNEQ